MINYSSQFIDNNDIKSVVRVLKSKWLTTGPFVNQFENEIRKKINSKYCTVVNSATSALHLACISLGLKKGDYIWTSSNTFVSTANCALLCGAKVDLVDINLSSYNIDINKLEKKLISAKKKKKLPKILIPVHFAGQTCNMKKIFNLSKKFNFKIIEDASHAFGSKYLNNYVGNCKFSHVTVFSFHPVKIFTTGEGGAITTNDKKIDSKLKSLRTHGIKYKLKKNLNKKRPWMFYQTSLGLNYRLTDIQAGLGISQLKKVDKFLKIRNKIAKIYNKELKNLPIKLPLLEKNVYSSFHLYVILLKTKNRDLLYKEFLKKGFKTNVHYIPIYKHPYFKKLKFNIKNFQNNEIYFKNALSIPISPSLTEKNILSIVKILKNFFKK
tara:strand:- start:570 stop:1715 length:1146 start_codon:yes stop_codon:yes gene_type:complete